MTPADLSRLSTLLDQALELPVPEREVWLATLSLLMRRQGAAARAAPAARRAHTAKADQHSAKLAANARRDAPERHLSGG